MTDKEIQELTEKIWKKYPINEELYISESEQNAYKAGVFDGLLEVKEYSKLMYNKAVEDCIDNVEIIHNWSTDGDNIDKNSLLKLKRV